MLRSDLRMSDADEEEQDLEVCPHGGELAATLAEEFYPEAIKFFIGSQEKDDDHSDMEDPDEEFDSDDEDDEDARVDIRSLVQGKRKDKASSLSPVGLETPRGAKTRKT
ncbi:MAG: hypothetical protein INR71_14325 [Terriglobus roseus]|nr:hypothetical protein [Terriglobus roseus]